MNHVPVPVISTDSEWSFSFTTPKRIIPPSVLANDD